jgi:hypothetical protein
VNFYHVAIPFLSPFADFCINSGIENYLSEIKYLRFHKTLHFRSLVWSPIRQNMLPEILASFPLVSVGNKRPNSDGMRDSR